MYKMNRIAIIEKIILEAEDWMKATDSWNHPLMKREAYEAIREVLFPDEYYDMETLYPNQLSDYRDSTPKVNKNEMC